ncbi:MAG: adenylosuccinate synthase [Patescibacteria group bacterium]
MNDKQKKKVEVILGLQWGDEGKGKFIDFLVLFLSKKESLVVARFQGGSNAGHSIQFGDRHVVFHALPSGMLEKNTLNFIGAGVVVDVVSLQKEIAEIKDIAPWWRENLFIASEATVVVPTAKILDAAQEADRGASKIGTTGKAIGPTYSDFYGRTDDLSVYEALDEDVFKKRYEEIKASHMKTLSGRYGISIYENELALEEEKFFAGIAFLRTLRTVSSHAFMQESIANGKQIIAEGAQGTLLDVRFGTRRDVTSSHTTSGGVCVGLGIAPHSIGEVLGICKAYATRVGSGPFPTEIGGEEASLWSATHTRKDEENLGYDINDTDPLRQGIALRTLGKEYGATTGRLRRCGWLDLPLLKYAISLNGVTSLGITKLDVLDTLDEILVCVGYGGREYVDMARLYTAKPIYKTLPGWKLNTRGVTSYEQLPEKAKEYLSFIETSVGVPISFISTGPGRDEMIEVKK